MLLPITERIYEEPPRIPGDYDFDEDSDNDEEHYDRIHPSNENYMGVETLSLSNPSSPHHPLYDLPRPANSSYEKLNSPENEQIENPYDKMNLPGESDEHGFYEDMSKNKPGCEHVENPYVTMSSNAGQDSDKTENFYEKMSAEVPVEQSYENTEDSYVKIHSNKKSATLPTNRATNFKEKATRSMSLNLFPPEPPKRKGSLKSNKKEVEGEEEEELYIHLTSDERDDQDEDYDGNDGYDVTSIPSTKTKPVPLPRQPKKTTCYEDADFVLEKRYAI